MNKPYGILYICGTPIGNLEDISIRALRILKEVDIIAAEDTRRTLQLLNHFNIKNNLTSYHEHNLRKKGMELVGLLKEGKNIALVSDAGLPGISDPGQELVKLVIEEEIKVTVIPGPTASLTALILSGVSTERFIFEGFLPNIKKNRRLRLKELVDEEGSIILYEAPHRLLATLEDISNIFNEREIAVCRELTKFYEEIIRGSASYVLNHYSTTKPKGEIVIIIEGKKIKDDERPMSECMEVALSIEEHIKLYMDRGMDKKQAIKSVGKERKMPKNEVYVHSYDID